MMIVYLPQTPVNQRLSPPATTGTESAAFTGHHAPAGGARDTRHRVAGSHSLSGMRSRRLGQMRGFLRRSKDRTVLGRVKGSLAPRAGCAELDPTCARSRRSAATGSMARAPVIPVEVVPIGSGGDNQRPRHSRGL